MENINKKRDNFWKRFKVFLRALKDRLAACRLKAKADKSREKYWAEEVKKEPKSNDFIEEINRWDRAEARARKAYLLDVGVKKIKIKREKKRKSEELREAFKNLF